MAYKHTRINPFVGTYQHKPFKHGRLKPGETRLDRFFEMCEPVTNSGCWIWMGALGEDGYPRRFGPERHLAHRWSYENFRGPIPEGKQLDHTCRVHCCVNPDHLEVVTPRENVRRCVAALGYRRKYAVRTHCPLGHELTVENIYITKKGHKGCGICLRENNRRYYYEKRGLPVPPRSHVGRPPTLIRPSVIQRLGGNSKG